MKRIIMALLMAIASSGLLCAIPITASAQAYIGDSVGYAPPPIPWYPQPVCPGAGYIWTPGYWAWDADSYFWVPGTWVLAPAVGLLWTPGYWAWDDGMYGWHPGYWSQDVGFYGGIDYGYGYYGSGYLGGYWRDGDFYYNRDIDDLDEDQGYETYDGATQPQQTSSQVSYNGGYGGVQVRPTESQLEYAREQHIAPTSEQLDQKRLAAADPAQRFTRNRGRPQIITTARAGEFPVVNRKPVQQRLNRYRVNVISRPTSVARPDAGRMLHEPQRQPDGRPRIYQETRERAYESNPQVNRFGSAYRSRMSNNVEGWIPRRRSTFEAPEFHSTPVRPASSAVPYFHHMHTAYFVKRHRQSTRFRPPR